MNHPAPIIENDRDRRAFSWLCEQVGADAIAEAVERLPGNRRPYLTNIARVLGLEPPRLLDVPQPDSPIRAKVRAKLESLRG